MFSLIFFSVIILFNFLNNLLEGIKKKPTCDFYVSR